MTWTTIGPGGAIQPIAPLLMVVSWLTLVYALHLVYKVAQLRRLEAQTEDQEEDEEEREYKRRYRDAHGRYE